jgi:exosome complex RNA-binding protein Rrp42 (RNase PH superfamily)
MMRFVSNNVRSDGRLFHKCRATTVTVGVLMRNTVGSALVCMGHTQVVAAITLQVGTPSPAVSCSGSGDTNDGGGDLVVYSQVDSTYLERILCTCLCPKSLVIIPQKSAWRLQIVIQVLNDNGNVRDASLIAALAALKNTKLPTTQVDRDGIVSILETGGGGGVGGMPPLILSTTVGIPLTVGILRHDNDDDDKRGEIILVDPTTEEEQLVETKLTMVVTSCGKVSNVELAGRITFQQLTLVAKMAQGRAQEIMQLLE